MFKILSTEISENVEHTNITHTPCVTVALPVISRPHRCSTKRKNKILQKIYNHIMLIEIQKL